MNFSLLHDEFMAREMWNLSPHFSALDMTGPRKVSGHVSLTKPVWANIINWWKHEDDDISEDDENWMIDNLS